VDREPRAADAVRTVEEERRDLAYITVVVDDDGRTGGEERVEAGLVDCEREGEEGQHEAATTTRTRDREGTHERAGALPRRREP